MNDLLTLLAFQLRDSPHSFEFSKLASAVYRAAGGRMIGSQGETFLGNINTNPGDALALAKYVLDMTPVDTVASIIVFQPAVHGRSLRARERRPLIRDFRQLLSKANPNTIVIDPCVLFRFTEPSPKLLLEAHEFLQLDFDAENHIFYTPLEITSAGTPIIRQPFEHLVAEAAAKIDFSKWTGLLVNAGWRTVHETVPFLSGFGGRGEGTPDPPSGPEPPELSIAERQLNVWIEERSEEIPEPLQLGQIYTLCCSAGKPVDASLSGGESAKIGLNDVPPGGLRTEWMLLSRSIELKSSDPEIEVEMIAQDGGTVWVARFPLLIPEQADSAIRSLEIIPRSLEDARISVVINSLIDTGAARYYRSFAVQLDVTKPVSQASRLPLEHEDVGISGRLAGDAPRARSAASSWLMIAPRQDVAVVTGTVNGIQVRAVEPQWPSNQRISAAVERVMKDLEAFRVTESGSPDRLNDIDTDDLIARLSKFVLLSDWTNIENAADSQHRQAWEVTSRSTALRNLADAGYGLYETFFPSGSLLRDVVGQLRPGDPLEIFWSERSPTTPHVPWGLMFRDPDPGQSIDPTSFLGLRLRITYTAHGNRNGETALGTMPSSTAGVTLYWGLSGNGEIENEAKWQRGVWQPPRTIPRAFEPRADARNAKQQLTKWLKCPDPQPMPMLYFYCRTARDGGEPILLFGETGDDKVRLSDIGWETLPSAPLVFANACSTSATDPDRVNEFEDRFFSRHCRAYLGTECRVGARLASRFAYIFYDLFERRSGGRTMTAGEAVAQGRLFLWSHYRNLGGLFYSLINQSELYFVDEISMNAEVS